ncbi:hypothetical protein QOT17_005187 [Balamuthia mandrillaris]
MMGKKAAWSVLCTTVRHSLTSLSPMNSTRHVLLLRLYCCCFVIIVGNEEHEMKTHRTAHRDVGNGRLIFPSLPDLPHGPCNGIPAGAAPGTGQHVLFSAGGVTERPVYTVDQPKTKVRAQDKHLPVPRVNQHSPGCPGAPYCWRTKDIKQVKKVNRSE